MPRLVERLVDQSKDKPAEILCLIDNKRRSIGAKRNALLDMANGKFIAFIDDDDMVTTDYIDTLLEAIKSNPDADCIIFDILIHGYGKPKMCRYDKDSGYGYDAANERFRRWPNHLMCYKIGLARKHRFRDQRGEDDIWAHFASKDIVRQVRIDRILYHYLYDPNKSEGQEGYSGNSEWK